MNLEQIRDAITSDTEFITSDDGNFIGIVSDDVYTRVLKARVNGEIRMTTKYLDRPDVADKLLRFWSGRLEIKND